MNKYIRPIGFGLLVAVVVFVAMNWLDAQLHRPPGFNTWFATIFLGVFTAYLLANLAGNRKVATADAATQAAALTFTPPPGQALIYVYREGFVGKAAGMNLSIDGKVVAQLTAPRFTCVAVSPGEHRLAMAFGGLAGPQNKAAETVIQTAADTAYVFKMAVSMGLIQNSITLQPQPDLAAMKTVLGRMKMTAPDIAQV